MRSKSFVLFVCTCLLLSLTAHAQFYRINQEEANSRRHSVMLSFGGPGGLATAGYEYAFNHKVLPFSLRAGLGYGFASSGKDSSQYLFTPIPSNYVSGGYGVYSLSAGIGMLPGNLSHRFDGAYYTTICYVTDPKNTTVEEEMIGNVGVYHCFSVGYRYINYRLGLQVGAGLISCVVAKASLPIIPTLAFGRGVYLTIGYTF